MDIKEAMKIIDEVKDDLQESGFLETLIFMQQNLEDFTPREVQAFRVVFRSGQLMFGA